ncbi:MAG: serine hydrolase domain-containing protein [Myxococcota bacterium]
MKTAWLWLIVALGCGDDASAVLDSGADTSTDAGAADVGIDAGAQTPLEQAWAAAVDDGFSGVAIVQRGDETLLAEAAGEANRAMGIPNTRETVFDMGSLSKQFTGALLARLAERGALSVEDTIGDFFPEAPADKAGITIHQLLTHTSGFPESLGFDYDALDRAGFLEDAFAAPLEAEPGEVHLYSNVGYSMAAAIAEVATGATYEAALRTEILDRADLAWTGYLTPAWSERTVATAYQGGVAIVANELPWGEEGPYWNLLGNGGLLTTADDLVRWSEALAEEEVLTAESLALYQGRLVDEGFGDTFYGYGWVQQTTPAGELSWHDGGNGFYLAEVLRFRDAELTIVMLANEDNRASVRLTRSLARAALPVLGGWDG